MCQAQCQMLSEGYYEFVGACNEVQEVTNKLNPNRATRHTEVNIV
jgi:hypothetical protein